MKNHQKLQKKSWKKNCYSKNSIFIFVTLVTLVNFFHGFPLIKFNVLFQNMKKKCFLIEIINYDIVHSKCTKREALVLNIYKTQNIPDFVTLKLITVTLMHTSGK